MSANTYRSTLERLTKDKAGLEQSLARERDKMGRLHRDVSSIARSVSSATSHMVRQSKQRQIASKQQELGRIQQRIAHLESKIASKLSDIQRVIHNIERAEEQQKKRQDADARRQRDEELRHARAVTRETERQAQIHAQLRGSRLVIDVARLPDVITVLFIASNPLDQSALRLDEEIRAVGQMIRSSEHRDSVRLQASWAARPKDLEPIRKPLRG